MTLTPEQDKADIDFLEEQIKVFNESNPMNVILGDGDVEDVFCLSVNGEDVLVNVEIPMALGYILGMNFIANKLKVPSYAENR